MALQRFMTSGGPRRILAAFAVAISALVAGCTSSNTLIQAALPTIAPPKTTYASLVDDTFTVPAAPIKRIPPQFLRQVVDVPASIPGSPGTVVVDPGDRFLYLIIGGGKALRYGIGVGKAGFAWSGEAQIKDKQHWPKWYPPSDMIDRDPKLQKLADGQNGGPTNPLGARAMYLWSDGIDTLYRIHGTNDPLSIGKAVSSGCVRMLDQDVIDLYDRVDIGTKVIVLPANGATPLADMIDQATNPVPPTTIKPVPKKKS